MYRFEIIIVCNPNQFILHRDESYQVWNISFFIKYLFLVSMKNSVSILRYDEYAKYENSQYWIQFTCSHWQYQYERIERLWDWWGSDDMYLCNCDRFQFSECSSSFNFIRFAIVTKIHIGNHSRNVVKMW